MFLAFLVTRHPAHFLLMISEGLVVALLLIRRPSQEIAKTPFALDGGRNWNLWSLTGDSHGRVTASMVDNDLA